MEKTILKTNCIIISIVIVLQMIGNPLTAEAGWHSQAPQEKSSTGTWILLGVASALLITAVIMATSKKKKKQHTYLYQRINYSKLYISSPLDYRLTALKQEKAKQKSFAIHFLKSNSWASPVSNTILRTRLTDFSFDKKWDTNVFASKQKLFTFRSKFS